MMVNIKINNIITFINDDRKKSIFFFKDQSLLFIEAGNTNMIVITILFNCQTTLFLFFDNFLLFFFSSNYQKRCTSLLSTSLLYWIHQLFIIAYLFDAYSNYNIDKIKLWASGCTSLIYTIYFILSKKELKILYYVCFFI